MQIVSGKNLIEWKLEALPDAIREVIIVIGHQGDQIKKYFGDNWKERTIRYVVQKELNGTAGALWAARKLLRGRFLVMMGDDLYGKEDITNILAHELAICVKEVWNEETGGELLANPDGTFSSAKESRHFVEHGFVNTGLYMMTKKIFEYSLVPVSGSSAEFGLPHTLAALAKETSVVMVKATKWLRITTPEDLKRAEEFVAG